MLSSGMEHRGTTKRTAGRLFAAALLIAAQTASATTYISAEPIPNVNIVGEQDLGKITSIGYSNLEQWSQRLLDDCSVVDEVIEALSDDGAISTVTSTNTHVVVAAGGFEAVTDPSYVLTVEDSGCHAVSEADVDVLDNALGYVLNQGGTTHFSTSNPNAYAFAIDYALVTFTGGPPTGDQAREFFDHVGTVDAALWSGEFAGFTQIDFGGSSTNDSLLFLRPSVSKHRFATSLSAAASTAPLPVSYSPLTNNGRPTTARAGVAFPENDWLAFPNGDGYLVNIPASPQLLSELAALRQLHLSAVDSLIDAIDQNNVQTYLDTGFTCPN